MSVHYFKLAGQRFALDTASGYVTAVDEIAYKMLVYLTPPLPEDCPSAIRYDMAKYDSQLVAKTYASLLELHKAGKLFTDVPFAPETFAKKQLILSSAGDPVMIGDMAAGFSLTITDTDDPDAVIALCKTAKAAGAASVTVYVTKDGSFDADRLMFSEAQYDAHKKDAPQVGVVFTCGKDVPSPLAEVVRLADAGVKLIDMKIAEDEISVTALCKELSKVAKELFLREKEGRPVTFLPFARMEGSIQAVTEDTKAFSADRCAGCDHRMCCSGRYVDDTQCAVMEACADAQIFLNLNR